MFSIKDLRGKLCRASFQIWPRLPTLVLRSSRFLSSPLPRVHNVHVGNSALLQRTLGLNTSQSCPPKRNIRKRSSSAIAPINKHPQFRRVLLT